MNDGATEDEIPLFVIYETLVDGKLRKVDAKEIKVKPNQKLVLTINVVEENERWTDFSTEEIFGRPFEDVPLDDLIAELQARRKEGPEVWLALRKMIFEQIADFAQRPADAPKWRDEWVKENNWNLVTDDDEDEDEDPAKET